MQAWDELAWHAPQRNPTLLPAWTIAFLRHRLAADETWLCSFAYAGQQLVGVLPVVAAPHPILGPSYPRLRTPFRRHAPSGDVLLRADVAGAALDGLLLELRRQIPSHLGIRFANVRKTSAIWQALRNPIRGYAAMKGAERAYSVLDVSGDFATYLEPHSSLRRNLRNYSKKLAQHGEVKFEIRRDGFDRRIFQIFLALEASGWKGRNGTAIADDERSTAFYSDLAMMLTRQGRWEWHILRVGERVAAAGMGVRCGSALMIPKIAFDEDFADCRPGNILTAEVIKAAFADADLTEINHMSNASWHRLWHMSEEPYGGVDFIRSSAVAALFHRPGVLLEAAYRDLLRPSVPVALTDAVRRFLRRRRPKPRRAAEAAATYRTSKAPIALTCTHDVDPHLEQRQSTLQHHDRPHVDA